MGLPGSVYKKLQVISGKSNVTTAKEELLCYSYDATGRSYLPDVVVFPGSEDEVCRILKLASQKKIIVTPRGAGSGMTGGALPVEGGIILAFSRMNRIIDINENNFTLRVQPGAIVGDIHTAVEEKGLFYPVDPASAAICSIGGNIAECAGGPRAVKYGVTKDYVLGLRAVLASGDVIRTGVGTVKGVAGYDLTRLITGSEGTLAVITEITLRLIAKPPVVRTLAVTFDSMIKAARMVPALMKQSLVPRCVEYLDRVCLELIREHLVFKLDHQTNAMLILEVDGDSAGVETQLGLIREICQSSGALNIITAQNNEETQKIWDARKKLSPVMYKVASAKINEDIVVPVDKIPDMVAATRRLEKKYQVNVVAFGHAGDGNIHCNILYDRTNPQQSRNAHKAVDELFDLTLELGGTITGEHGVGITKKDYLPRETGSLQIELMRGIKKVFDPDNILNPGKIF